MSNLHLLLAEEDEHTPGRSWLKMCRATFSLFCAPAGYVPEAVDLS